MDIQMFQKHSKRTMNQELSQDLQWATLTLGINGEIGEVVKVITHQLTSEKFSEEIGDVFWYVANLCTLMKIELESLIHASNREFDGNVYRLFEYSAEVSDSIKKTVGHGHELDVELVTYALTNIVSVLKALLMIANVDLGSVLADNHIKLMKRYPGGFEAGRSINREV